MDTLQHGKLIAALAEMPERELVEVVNHALSRRSAEVAAPEFEEARLLLAEAHRGRNGDGQSSQWELLVLASPMEPGAHNTEGAGPTQEGSCCGVTLAAYAKSVICPLCGNPADAT